MPYMQDEKGIATFPSWGGQGHFVYVTKLGKNLDRPYVKLVEIEKARGKMAHPSGWQPRLRDFNERQLEKRRYNIQMTIPLDEIPAVIAALVKTYEAAAPCNAPAEGQPYAKQYLETEADRDAQRFTRGSSEF